MKIHKMISKVARMAVANGEIKDGTKFAKETQERLDELIAMNADESEALKTHTHLRVYPSITIYETLQVYGLSKERAHWYVREYFQILSRNGSKFFQGFFRLFGLYKKGTKIFFDMSVKSFSEEAGFVYRFPEQRENVAAFDIIKCPYLEACKRYGCAELVPAFCDSDDTTYGDMHPCLIWKRTGTIGRGNECCDFRLTLVDKEEASR